MHAAAIIELGMGRQEHDGHATSTLFALCRCFRCPSQGARQCWLICHRGPASMAMAVVQEHDGDDEEENAKGNEECSWG